ncbi:hypothetical protein Acr_06g0004520 [Actinidia rufa]|uniref:Uncharacterized protein n=1 Tax=Actinidia rufa TaxID=165716 RepID=A0A7J0EQB9_9ERIC|nr:hypothetical protein Acr_06g0004520 [Actinidia rufa]
MEGSSGISPRKVKHDDSDLEAFELESVDHGVRSDHQFRSTSALEILRETVRILRYNSVGFMGIAALLICPVSAVFLSNMLVDQSIVKKLTIRLLLVAKSSGLPLRPFIKQSCHKFSEMVIFFGVVLPFVYHIVSVVKSSGRVLRGPNLFEEKVRRLPVLCHCYQDLEASCFDVFVGVCGDYRLPHAVSCSPCSCEQLIFGPQALLRSSVLIRGQTQWVFLIFLGSTIGMAFVEGLFEHRVKTLSYGDGSSRIWEGPLLVLMYSFVVLIDSMMSAVFYFSCSSYSMEALNGECQSVLKAMTISSGYTDIK